MNKELFTLEIKKIASDLGFSLSGVSNPRNYINSNSNLDKWLDDGMHASMEWINNRKEERNNIYSYFPEIRSVISLGYNYYTESEIKDQKYKISNYAWGEDYHIILKNKLEIFIDRIKEIKKNDFKYRLCVDTSPIMEKLWAKRSGLGWIGKHTNLISPKKGTWFFLSEILLDFDLIYDDEFNYDLCGTCTKCIDECPTNALYEYKLDSNKCISYLTIEHRGALNKEIKDKLSNWIYGCDICQEVCPWNVKYEIITNDENFKIRSDIKSMNQSSWENLNEDKFKKIFKKSAIKRTKYTGLKRNIELNKNNY